MTLLVPPSSSAPVSPSASLSDGSLAEPQLCLFWTSNAIRLPVSWRFNQYRVTLPKQHYPLWESGAVVFPVAAKRRARPLQWTVMSPHQSKKSSRLNPFSRLRPDSKGRLIQFSVTLCIRFIFISSRLQISFLLPLTLLLFTYFIHPPPVPHPLCHGSEAGFACVIYFLLGD